MNELLIHEVVEVNLSSEWRRSNRRVSKQNEDYE